MSAQPVSATPVSPGFSMPSMSPGLPPLLQTASMPVVPSQQRPQQQGYQQPAPHQNPPQQNPPQQNPPQQVPAQQAPPQQQAPAQQQPAQYQQPAQRPGVPPQGQRPPVQQPPVQPQVQQRPPVVPPQPAQPQGFPQQFPPAPPVHRPQVSAPPASGPPAGPAQGWAPPASGPPASGPPASGPPVGPGQGWQSGGQAYPSAVRPTNGRRTGTLVTAVGGGVLAVVLLVAGIVWAVNRGGGDDPGGGDPSNQAAPAVSAACGHKVAFLGILAGTGSKDSNGMRNAAKLAVDDYNGKHPGCNVGFAEFDTKGTEEGSRLAAEDLVADSEVIGVVGPAYRVELLAAGPILDKAGVPFFTPFAPDVDLAGKGWSTFHRLIANDKDQANAGARYIKNKLRASKVVVVYDDTDFGGVARRRSRAPSAAPSPRASRSDGPTRTSPVPSDR